MLNTSLTLALRFPVPLVIFCGGALLRLSLPVACLLLRARLSPLRLHLKLEV